MDEPWDDVLDLDPRISTGVYSKSKLNPDHN
jgi:hypothetical protein